MKVEIGSIHIAFPKAIKIRDVFIEDPVADTLLYCHQIKIDADLIPLIRQRVNIDHLLIDGLKAKIYKKQSDGSFNFSPFIDVFTNTEKVKKETVDSSWKIGFDKLELRNIKATYNNRIDSSGISLDLGHLLITANSTDVISGKYNIKKIDLQKTSLSILIAQTTTQEETDNSPSATFELPFDIDLKKVNLEDIHFDLNSVHGNLALLAGLKQAQLKPKKLDLKTSGIELDNLKADGIEVALQIMPRTKEKRVNNKFTFGEFPWNFSVNQLEVTNTSYEMDLGPEDRDPSGMDYRHMNLRDFNFLADSAYFNRNSTGAKIKQLQVKEISGAELTQVEGKFSMDNQSIRATDIGISTARSSMKGTVSLGYTSLSEFGKYIEKLEIRSDLHGNIHVSEIAPFISVLDQYPILANLDQVDVKNLIINGSLDNLTLESCSAGIGNATLLRANGSIEGLPSTDLNIRLDLDTLLTSSGDIMKILPDTLLPAQITLPEVIGITVALNYLPDSMDFNAIIKTDIGDLWTETQLSGNELSSDFRIQSLDIGQLLNDSTYGEIMMDGQFKGTQSEGIYNVFKTELDIQSIDLFGYIYNNLQMDVERKDNLLSFYSSINDTVISLIATGEALLRESSNHYNLDIKVKNADLKGMNLLNEDFVISGNIDINTDFTSRDNIDGTFVLSDINLSNAAGNYQISEMKLISDIKKEYTNFDLTSDIINASLTGNTKIAELKTAFYNHINNYIAVPDSLLSKKEHRFDFDLSLNEPYFFTNFLIDGLQEFTIDHCHASYEGANDLFEVDIKVPKLSYANWELDGLSFLLNSEEDSIITKIELDQFSYDSAFVKNISFKTKFAEQKARLLLSINDIRDSLKYHIETNVANMDGSYIISLNPEKLIIDHRKWFVDQNNKVIIKNRDISIQSALLTHDNQKIWLESADDHLKLNFKQFEIQNITGILEKEKAPQILKGRLNGTIDVIDLFGELTVKNDLIINDLSSQEVGLGNLKALIDFKPQEAISYSLSLTDDINSIKLDGRSEINSESSDIEAALVTDITQAEVFSDLVGDYLTGLNGGVNGRIEIIGEIANPRLSGQMNFNDLSMTIGSLNTLLTANGSVSVKDNQVEFKNFNVSDSLNHHISVKGSIDARKLIDPEFDLELTSPDFVAVNNKEEKNKSVVGKLLLGMDIDVKGKLSNLVVNSGFTINKNTDIMYVLPGKDLELITDEGVVVFTDFEDKSDTVMTLDPNQFIADSLISMIKGIDLTVNLKIDPQAQFSIYLDPNSGDITSFKLNGNLQYKYNDTQRGHLNGLLELKEGFYELSFYGLVKKKFVYDPGSTIAWSGNVMDGEVNFSARHEVRTNSVGLVSNEISSYEKSMYNQRLPYEVIINIDNQILYPVISFGIDLPDRYKNDNPTIAAKLNILNQPGMESERNKQVFALLVGGTFIPDNPDVNEGTSSNNFATTAARNSMNAIMTQQLNNLTGQFIKGIDVDMGVNTYDDYTSDKAQTRTQLDVKVSKKMFNDRVSAEVESHIDLEGVNTSPGTQSTAGMAEFAVSYQITESGNYHVKAFRENAFDIFDGEIQNAGIAFIFIKEFDSFKNNSPHQQE
ncbi:MAG: translocation/assembly module TamB domain-containing protein [Bacteroidales bacterium]|nr:translocation/assembly module TamB domain-containing protein [Bacteroidales bacterium]